MMAFARINIIHSRFLCLKAFDHSSALMMMVMMILSLQIKKENQTILLDNNQQQRFCARVSVNLTHIITCE